MKCVTCGPILILTEHSMNKHQDDKRKTLNLCEMLKLRKKEDKSHSFVLLLCGIRSSDPGGVISQSFNVMLTHVSFLSLANSPAGLYTVGSRPPTEAYRGAETGCFNNSVLFNSLLYSIQNPFPPCTCRIKY